MLRLNLDGEEMTENQVDEQTENSVPAKPQKKASWLRTILWMLSMLILFNVVAAILVMIFMSPEG